MSVNRPATRKVSCLYDCIQRTKYQLVFQSKRYSRFLSSIESVYYAFIKTGRDSCSKGCSPILSLFDHTGKTTELNMKPVSRIFSPSVNNHMALEKYQLDIFQWQDRSIESIERMQLTLNSSSKQSRCHWPVEWMLVVHHGCSFTGQSVNPFKSAIRFVHRTCHVEPNGENGSIYRY